MKPPKPISVHLFLFIATLAGGMFACRAGASIPPSEVTLQERRTTVLDAEDLALPWSDEIPEAPRRDGHLKFRRIDVGGVELRVATEGEGVPLVLLNGGPGQSSHAFVPHFTQASRFARVVYYDPRGVGLSARDPDGKYSAAQAIADLEAVREALGFEDWVVLGWSWGGHLARLYALCHPERVRGLVLVGATARFEVRKQALAVDLLGTDERKRIRACYTYQGRPVLPDHTDKVPAEHVARMLFNAHRNGDWKRTRYFQPTEQELAQFVRYEWIHDAGYALAMRRSGELGLRGAFDGAPFPTLVIDGRWDGSASPEKPQLLAREMGGARVEVLQAASHYPFAEEPERFFSVLQEFVRDTAAPDSSRVETYRGHAQRWREKILR